MKVIVISLILLCGFQSDAPQVKVSATPLDGERVAVYRAFVSSYEAGTPATLNLANLTSSFAPDDGDFAGCMKGFPVSKPLLEVHSLAGAFDGVKGIKLVDASKHKLSDPEDGMRKGQSVDDAVRQGFAAALMTVSEIRLDADHSHAALNYSFHCGMLCGNGGTVVLEKKSGKRGRSRRNCGGWIS